ncbi:MAG: PHP domain-containing protein [Candidatus Pacebacteria bacterium]|nr:PHP domain-containing protein [Candidatus Paceibacterota bacterium]
MKADLHIHSDFSDGCSSIKMIIESALDKGIRCISICDHNEIKGAVLAMKLSYDKNILVIPGIEILTKSGDVLGINVKKVIPNGLSAEEAVKEIRRQKGLAVIPHPFHWPVKGFSGGEKRILEIMPDAIEVFNSSVFFDWINKKAFDLSKRSNICFTAGSDAHRAEFVGRGYLELSGKVTKEEDVLEEIMNKKAGFGGIKLSFFEIFKNFFNGR